MPFQSRIATASLSFSLALRFYPRPRDGNDTYWKNAMARLRANEELTPNGKRLSNKYRRNRHRYRRAKRIEIRELSGYVPRKSVSVAVKREVLQKTGNKCHMCGKRLTIRTVQIGHIKARALGGADAVKNYLPSCASCNRARWILDTKEIEEILRLGIWARTEIENATSESRPSRIGRIMANAFATTNKSK